MLCILELTTQVLRLKAMTQVTIQHIKPKLPSPSLFLILCTCMVRFMNIVFPIVMLRRRRSISLNHRGAGWAQILRCAQNDNILLKNYSLTMSRLDQATQRPSAFSLSTFVVTTRVIDEWDRNPRPSETSSATSLHPKLSSPDLRLDALRDP